jgi:hypothetical protein
MLLYKDGNFMQVLEGPYEVVTRLYSTISADPRHYGVLELIRQQIDERAFGSWSMGFRNLEDKKLYQTPGYSMFLNEPLNAAGFQADPTRAQRLLRMFRENM